MKEAKDEEEKGEGAGRKREPLREGRYFRKYCGAGTQDN